MARREPGPSAGKRAKGKPPTPKRRAPNKPRRARAATPAEPPPVAGGLALPRSKLARALGAVLRERIDDQPWHAGRDRRGLARVISPELEDAAASVQASRMFAGQRPWPDQHWEAIAAYVGLTGAELLEQVLDEYARATE